MQFKSRELSAEQLSAIQMLVYTDMLKADIAQECGISERQIYNWMKMDRFKDAYTKEVQAKVAMMSGKALKQLDNLLTDKDSRTKMQAVKLVLQELGVGKENIKVDAGDMNITVTLIDEPK